MNNRALESLRFGVLIGAMFGAIGSASGEILFQENFDELADWNSGLLANDLNGDGKPDTVQISTKGYQLPSGWYSARQDPSWAPSTGYPDRHENIEITGANADKARGGVGKSMVVWRDSTTEPTWRWNSDGILSKFFLGGFDQIYVSFWIRFEDNWTPLGESGGTKLFRIASWDGNGQTDGIYQAFSYGEQSALFLWDYAASEYGVRDFLSFRGDPQETNYTVTNPAPIATPRNVNDGSMSLNFTGNIRDLNGDGVEDNKITSLLDLTTGQPIGLDGTTVTHDELWGNKWHRVEFYVKMNSAPGKMDGVAMQWIDGQLVFDNHQFPWMGFDSPGGIKWNVVHFGGNSHFHAYPDSDRREEWYSIDDIVIRSDLPASRSIAPNPPSDVSAD